MDPTTQVTTFADQPISNFSGLLSEGAFKECLSNPLSYSKTAALCRQESHEVTRRVEKKWNDFFIRDKERAELIARANKLNEKAQELEMADRAKFKELATFLSKQRVKARAPSAEMLNYIGMGTLDKNNSLKEECFRGTRCPLTASLWMQDHVAAFIQDSEYLLKHPEHIPRMHKILQDLARHSRIEAAFKLWPKKNDWTFGVVQDEILGLKIGEEGVFGGGVLPIQGVKGHGVQYAVKRESENAFTLIFINTGAVAPVSLERKYETTDEGWNKIPQKKISMRLANTLMEGRLEHVIPLSFEEVKTKVKEELNLGLPQRIGRSHSLHKQKSCCIKSLTSWLHGRMDPDQKAQELWREFKVIYTRRQIDILPSLRQFFHEKEGYSYYDIFLDATLVIYKGRCEKLQKLLDAEPLIKA